MNSNEGQIHDFDTYPIPFMISPLRSLQQTLNFHHSLFPEVEGTPHALQLIVVTLYCHLVEHGIVRLSKLHLDVIHSVARSPIIQASVRCEQSQIEPIRRSDARESCKNRCGCNKREIILCKMRIQQLGKYMQCQCL